VATRFDPFRELERLFDESLVSSRTGALVPMDLSRVGDHYIVRVDLPGADPQSIEVSVDDRMLTIRGERSTASEPDAQWLMQERPSGTFARQIALGRGLSVDAISAEYRDGVLTLTIPVAAEAKPRRIEVSHQSSGNGGTSASAEKQQQLAS